MSTRLERRVVAKTAAYTVKYPFDQPGTIFSNRGATGSVTFTLPTPGLNNKGHHYEFRVHAAQTLIVAGAASGALCTIGNAAADNVSFATASAKVGRGIFAVSDGTQWLAYTIGAFDGFCVNGTEIASRIGGTALTATAAELNILSGVTATAAELNKSAGVTGGTVTASKAVVVDANSAVDLLRATTSRTLGGTGVPAAANVVNELVKEVTAITDASATAILTVTVPNAAHAGMIDVAVVGRLGAGGTIGADEAISSSRYQFTFARTAGVASVLTASAQLGAVNVAVAGATTVTATLSVVNNAEGVGVANTHTIKVTITKGGGSSANHKCDVHVRLHNCNATGVTIA